MSSRSGRPARRPVAIALCLMLGCVATAVVCAAAARAADYRLVLCAADSGAGSYQTATNTAYPAYPGGIFSFEDHCGPAPYPAGSNAFLRIREIAEGSSAEGAYGSISWTAPPYVAILAGGGYTREPYAFNPGWRARFWAEGFDGSAKSILMQGGGGVATPTTSIFAPHLWPFSSYGYFRRFVFEMTCYRPAGCDRSGANIVDANTLLFVLADVSPAQLHLANTGSPLLSGRWVSGTQTAAYSLSEAGSGIRLEWIDVDGARRFTIDHAGECDTGYAEAGGEFARSFKPCPAASNLARAYALDTASLPDGVHELRACAQDYAQWQGLDASAGQSCEARTIRTDNTPPGRPAALAIQSPDPNRYLDRFGASFSLPPNQGSPIAAVHYEILGPSGEVLVPEKTVSGTDPTELAGIEGPKTPGAYRLKLWLSDEVGFSGPAAEVEIPHDTTPPAAPQDLQVAAPEASRSAEGFDVRWRDIVDAGSPIDAAHYQVLDGEGRVAVPTQTVRGEGIAAIEDLEAPSRPGPYTLRLWLEDEEGNAGAPASAPLLYRCLRSEVAGGTSLSAGLGAGGVASAVVRQGRGSILSGRLSGPGGGVAGASICVFARILTQVQREFLGIAVSGPGGGYGFAIPAGASRELSALYRSGHRELGAGALLQTVVRPAFGVRRRVVRNGQVAHFAGRIPGPDNDDVVVVLQVRRGASWLAFRRYRTRNGGRVAVGYRFTRTEAPTRYVMRAQVLTQSGYPYLQGNSRRLALIVLPRRRGRR